MTLSNFLQHHSLAAVNNADQLNFPNVVSVQNCIIDEH